MSLFDEVLDSDDLFTHVFGSAGADCGGEEVEVGPIFFESGGIEAGEIPDIGKSFAFFGFEALCHFVFTAPIGDVIFGEVPDVGDVADGRDLPSDRLGGSDDEVGGDEGAEVADVGVGVDGWSAGIHAQVVRLGGRDGFHLPGEGIVEFEFLCAHGDSLL